MENLAQKAESLRNTIDINIFKGYDIRGDAQITTESPRVNLREEDAFLIGQSLASSYVLKKQTPRFLITSDHRPTSNSLRLALAAGIKESGGNATINEEPIPTGATSWAILEKRNEFDAAIQITGSHNPYYNNGFKITSKQDANGNADINGFPQALYGSNLKKVYQDIVDANVVRGGEGEISFINTINRDYQEEMIAHFSSLLPNKKFQTPFRVVLDAGNGLGCKAVPILEALGIELYEMFTDLQPTFPNHPADPSAEEGVSMAQNKVKELNENLSAGEQPWIALVFDGDGDRSGVIAEDGNVVYPEQILAIFYIRFLLENATGFKLLKEIKQHVGLALDVRGTAVVGDLIDRYREEKDFGVIAEFIPCGYPNHRTYVREQIEKLNNIQNNLSDEQKDLLEKIKSTYTSAEASGHFFYSTCTDIPDAMVDDGIFSAIKLLCIVDSLADFEAKANFIEYKDKYKIYDIFNAIDWRPVSNEIRGKSPYADIEKQNIISEITTTMRNEMEKQELFSQQISKLIDVDGVRVVFADSSFLLVRASQTSPKFTYKFEAQTKGRLKEVISETIKFLKSYEKQGVSTTELEKELLRHS